jgi:hypothetical protein
MVTVDAKCLRQQADRCRRLARSIYNPTAAAELEAYAEQLEGRAAVVAPISQLENPTAISTDEPEFGDKQT